MPTIATQLKLEGIGLSISDCEIHQSTGPLFDFGTLDNRRGQRNFECVVGLSDCTLRNLTTPNHPQLIDHNSKMEQKVVNCELSWSFGNIWGAISCGLETAGSFFGMNSSFSNIQPSSLLSAPHSPPAPSTSISDSSAHDELTCDELRLISCGFWKIEGTDALIHLNVTLSSSSRTVTLNDCSFCECGCCEGSASTLLLSGIGSIGLFDVSFVRCGGFDGSSIVVIENSFVDSTSSVHFVESGSSELCLTDLVNVAEFGLIGDTDSPSPSPFLSPIPRTLQSNLSNQAVEIYVSTRDDGNMGYFVVIFNSQQLKDYSLSVELTRSVDSEFHTVHLDKSGNCELHVNYQPDGIFFANDYVDVVLQEPVPGGHQIEFFPTNFLVPQQYQINPQMDVNVFSTSPDQSTVVLSFDFRDAYYPQVAVTLTNYQSPYDEWTINFNAGMLDTFHVTAILYQADSDEVDLKWGGLYLPSRATDDYGTDLYLHMFGEVVIPPEPARIEGIESRSFSDKTVLTLKGRLFTGDIQFSLKPVTSSSSTRNGIEYSFTAEVKDSNTATCAVPAVEESLASSDIVVVFGSQYSMFASIIVNSGLTHTISPPVSAFSIDPQVSEDGMECTLVVTGTGFIEAEHFVLVLAESSDSNADPITLEFEIVMKSSTEGESARIELGSGDSLQFDTTYTIVKLHLSSDVELTVKTPPSLTTPSEPSLLVNAIFVDGGIATESNPCGTIASPCQTVDRALQIIRDALIVDMEILVTGSPVLSQSFEMGSGMTLVIERATKFTETIKIPTDAISSSPLVVLSGGRFKLDHLSFVIDCTSSSLCLFSTTNTEVELENVHMTGPSNGSTPTLNEEIDEVCSWETGLMKAQGGSISASECHFSHIQQGVFSLDGSTLEVSFCKFSSNSPRSSLYRSLQWNIRCVGSGSVIVETETSETSQQESHWISTSECSVTMDGEKSLSPFVVPTLSVSECSVSQKKSKDPLLIRIVGTKLIPCGLSFEIFETSDSKSNSKSIPVTPHRIPLSDPSVSSTSETEVLISVLESSTELEKSSHWDGRIVYGEEQATQSFTVKMSAKEKMARGAGKVVPWLVPLIVSLVILAVLAVIIILVVLRRRKQKKENEQEMQDGEVPVEDEKMEVVVTDHKLNTNPNNSLVSDPNDGETKDEVIPDSVIDVEEYIEALVCVDGVKVVVAQKKDTLYNRLHSQNRREVVKRTVRQQIASGLSAIAQKASDAAILKAVSSHNILFDDSGRVCFKTNMDIVRPVDQPRQSQQTNDDGNVDDGNVERNGNAERNTKTERPKEDPASESQRWLAPEVAEKKTNVIASQASVFSLGLVLWEIETGFVPYGEQDGVNAVRQIVAGVPPDLSQVKNAEMRELIEQCLVTNPKERPQLAEIATLLDEIEDIPEKLPQQSIES